MATTTKRTKPAAKASPKRTKPAAKASPKRTKPAAKASPKRTKPATITVDRTAKLSEEVLETVEKSQRAAIESVRKFVETVDHALPALPHGKGPTGRQEIVDSALEMADRLVHTQYDFIRKVIDNASKSLSGPDESK